MSNSRDLDLVTERLLLREFKEEDFPEVQEYASDPEVVRYMPWGPNSEQDTRDFIRKAITEKNDFPRMAYDIVLINRTDNRLMGACGMYIRNTANKEGEIGWVLNRRFWNRGYVSEAARSIVAFGFKELKLHRIFATCDPANTGSYRVMEKIGMRREGYLRDHKLMKGTWRDSLIYSILVSDGTK
jgi:[ribosomal protein S5]-alanine N-acetyltransferase